MMDSARRREEACTHQPGLRREEACTHQPGFRREE